MGFFQAIFGKDDVKGYVTVCGKGAETLFLDFKPKKAKAHFLDKTPPKAGCNQCSEDYVEIHIHKKQVTLKWQTSESREVYWCVSE